MMNKKEKIITLVTNSLALLLALLVLVPLGKSSVSNGEIVFKLIVAPICILAIFIVNSYIKYVVGTNEYKYTSLSAYLGLFAYVVALFGYAIETMLRTGASVVYATSTFVVLVAIFACIAAIFAAVGIYMQRFVIFLKSKECIFLDIVLVLLVVAITIVMRLVLLRHVGVPMDASVLQYIVVPLLFGLAVILVLVFVLLNYLRYNEKFAYYSRKELLEKWNTARDEVYHQALVDILFNLYNFSKNELGITEEAAPAAEEEAEEEAEEAEEEPVGAAEEEQPQVDPEELAAAEARLEELQKEKEELINEGAPEEAEPVKVAYPPKTFKPTFAELVRYASGLKDVTFQANEQGSNYKFFVGKKVFLIMVDGPKSYKMTFLMDLPEAAEYSQLVAFSKAKSPKGEYSFKLVNKGTFEASELKKIIKNARHMIDVIEERKQAAKEAEKARKAEEKLQAKLAAMTPEEREKYLKRLENAKKTPEQKAKEAEEKRLAKEAEKAKKEEEKAKKAAEKAAKEAEKAAKEAEKPQEQQPAEPAVEEAPVEVAQEPEAVEAPVEQPQEEQPAEEPQPEEAPAEEPQPEEAPAEEAQPEEQPAEEPQPEEAPAEEAQPEEAPAEEPQSEEQPAEEPTEEPSVEEEKKEAAE